MARRETKQKNGRTTLGKLNGRGAEAVDYGPLADWVGFNLRMAQAAAFQAFSRLAQEVGTRPGRFATLMLIASFILLLVINLIQAWTRRRHGG